MECEICHSNNASIYFFLPQEFIEFCNFGKCNSNSRVIPLFGDNKENVVYLCDLCKHKFGGDVIIPTNGKHRIFHRLSESKKKAYCNYLYENRVPLRNYLTDKCLSYSDEQSVFVTNMFCMTLLKELNEFCIEMESLRKE